MDLTILGVFIQMSREQRTWRAIAPDNDHWPSGVNQRPFERNVLWTRTTPAPEGQSVTHVISWALSWNRSVERCPHCPQSRALLPDSPLCARGLLWGKGCRTENRHGQSVGSPHRCLLVQGQQGREA